MKFSEFKPVYLKTNQCILLKISYCLENYFEKKWTLVILLAFCIWTAQNEFYFIKEFNFENAFIIIYKGCYVTFITKNWWPFCILQLLKKLASQRANSERPSWLMLMGIDILILEWTTKEFIGDVFSQLASNLNRKLFKEETIHRHK